MNEQINFGSVSFDCTEFTGGDLRPEKWKRVVISPIRILSKVDRENNDEYVIFQGCNMYQSCRNLGCVYSGASREQHREQRRNMPERDKR